MREQQKNNVFRVNSEKILMILKSSKIRNLLCYVSMSTCLGLIVPEMALAEFSLDNFGRSMADPAKKAFNDFYPVGILVVGGVGAFLNSQGDFRDRMIGFGKGATIGGLIVGAVKSGFGL